METFDVNDVAVTADLLQQRRLLAADELLLLGFCLMEQAAPDISIEVGPDQCRSRVEIAILSDTP